ncbi:hypothetical protein [Candidatus Reidiella endopervernicosa]|uniref:Uncharacterized protein n=1 Tax=Candidatus Reidiella endopervernicosa TaxID=2738883 RepID=A0A6N0HVB6_9GAMM|nr:hypothetical protein [Candidatus Reidiella endopervernicosa]QKQ26177.1 hypothetical protein HUE57_07675 [Candidatus Reidiella endopervernicosa]
MDSLRKLINNLFLLTTIGLAAAFVVVFLRPDLLNNPQQVVEIKESGGAQPAHTVAAPTMGGLGNGPVSYATAAKAAAPAVVNINTAKVAPNAISHFQNTLFRR